MATRPSDSKTHSFQASPTASGARPLGFAATLVASLEQIADGIVLLEPDPQVVTCARVVFSNPAFEKLRPNPPAPAVGQLLSNLFPEACLNEEFVAALEAGQAARAESACSATGEEPRVFEISLSPVRDPAGELNHWFGIVRDITALRRQARDRSERERLAAVALLAAGMAHEINNPLASVTTNLEWLAATLPNARSPLAKGAVQNPSALSAVSAALVDALAGAERVEATIQHLGLLSGLEYSQRELLDVRLLLDAALHELEPLFAGGIDIQREYADMPPVFVSERRLKQAFVNLLANAAQAIPPDATTRTVTVRALAGERVRIEIQDSGSGVPTELAAALFHPFVTTKPMGVGKGLGLYLAKSIIETAGGEIGFHAAKPRGTTFWVELPRADPSAKSK
ncbi:MAG TPA: PAS domain-containing sensor histidine kinase [Polyangiaceae bacterium]|nr:PAS domain-containing sensor histidine kinase [Polyangiaceae bacterium]